MTDLILTTTLDSMTTLTLNRPEKRNAMHGELIALFSELLRHIAADTTSQVLIIQGNGEHFCAGADIAWMEKMSSSSYADNDNDAQMLADLLYQLYTFPKPTIVLTHGVSLGGGLGLICASDIAIAASDASFGFSEVKIGITPATISPYVIAAIGERMAHYYFLTGERFACAEAQRIGLVQRVVARVALISTGLTIAKILLQNSFPALQAAKCLIRDVAKEKITPMLTQKTAEHLAKLRASPAAQQRLQAFLQKRGK